MKLWKWLVACLQQPACWLIAQGLGILVLFGVSGKLTVGWAPDSYTYSNPQWESFTDALSRHRTVGYPLLVQGFEWVTGSFRYLPVVHWGLHLGAVLLFYGGLCRLKIASWPAMIVASSLFYTGHFGEFCRYVLTDGPALSLAIATLGLLFWVIGRPSKKAAWIGLTAALVATYQVRPAYLFLIALVPVLGLSVLRLFSPRQEWHTEWKRLGLRLTLACIVPFLAFASFRYVMVGHFGLVSFGGINLIGIAGQFLTEDLVAELPQELRSVASDAIRRRKLLGHGDFANSPVWQSPYGTNGHLHLSALVEMYNPTINYLVGPAIVASFGDNNAGYYHVNLNQKMGEMSFAIIKARPMDYVRWVIRAFGFGLSFMWENVWTRSFKWLFVLLAVSYGISRWRGKHAALEEAATVNSNRDPLLLVKVMGLLFCSYTSCNLLLIVLVEAPLARYLTAAGVFLPGLLVAALISFSAGVCNEQTNHA